MALTETWQPTYMHAGLKNTTEILVSPQLELIERERKYYREQNRGNFEGGPADSPALKPWTCF